MGAESSTMQNAASTCRGCKNLGNKQMDTVKVDLSAAEKENSDPGQMRESPAAIKQRKEAEAAEQDARRRAEEERKLDERQRQLQLELEKLRKEKEEEEARMTKLKAEEARKAELARIDEQKRQQAEDEARQRQAHEERLRRQKEEEEEKAAKRREEEASETRRMILKEEEETRKNERLWAFLEKGGFNAVSEKKVKRGMISSGFFYPLHAAVEQKDAEVVELLLWAGADPCLANSKKLTPLQLAQAKNKQGSHDKVLAALAA